MSSLHNLKTFEAKFGSMKQNPKSRFSYECNALNFVVQDTKQGLCSVWNHVSHVGLELQSDNINIQVMENLNYS